MRQERVREAAAGTRYVLDLVCQHFWRHRSCKIERPIERRIVEAYESLFIRAQKGKAL